FGAAEPAMATLAERTFRRYGIAYLATVDSHCWPRLHPVSPAAVAGQLYIGIIPSSPKRRDLDRTGRFMLHCLPGPENVEVRFRGLARRLSDSESARLSEKGDEKTRLHQDTFYYILDIRLAAMTTYEARPADARPTPTHMTWREANDHAND